MVVPSVVRDRFPDAISQEAFVRASAERLAVLGFAADNAIACVGTCRDELCHSFSLRVEEVWGEAFNFSSLAGVPWLGKTGFSAAQAHAPIEGGRERYVYFGLPHIAINDRGEMGLCERTGRPGQSPACGALAAVAANLRAGLGPVPIDPDDMELGLLEGALRARLSPGAATDLAALTELTRSLILEKIERMIALTVDTEVADYAVFNATLIHGPGGQNWVRPASSYAVVAGERRDLRWG